MNAEEAKLILSTVAEARKYSAPFNPAELFRISEDLIAKLAFFISPLMDSETAYRTKIVEFGRENSATKAEQLAKASPEYAHWRKMLYVFELATHQINLTKKFAQLLDYERKNI